VRYTSEALSEVCKVKTVNLAPLCVALQVARTRVDKWISDGSFTPIDEPAPGKARSWTKQDALRLACFVRLVEAGLKVEVGKVIDRLSGFGIVSEPKFLVVLAHKRTVWRDGTSEAYDTRVPYEAFVVKKSEVIKQLGRSSWSSLGMTLINLADVERDVEDAWLRASAQQKASGN
jgi:hypothetical protein